MLDTKKAAAAPDYVPQTGGKMKRVGSLKDMVRLTWFTRKLDVKATLSFVELIKIDTPYKTGVGIQNQAP